MGSLRSRWLPGPHTAPIRGVCRLPRHVGRRAGRRRAGAHGPGRPEGAAGKGGRHPGGREGLLAAHDRTRGHGAKSPYGGRKRGNFVIVDFIFTNNGDEATTLDTASLVLIDSEGRESEADPDAYEYVEPGKDIFLENINPGVSKQGEAIFTVAPDAHGFVLRAGDTQVFEDKNCYFELGF